jgi:hypothetical protein
MRDGIIIDTKNTNQTRKDSSSIMRIPPPQKHTSNHRRGGPITHIGILVGAGIKQQPRAVHMATGAGMHQCPRPILHVCGKYVAAASKSRTHIAKSDGPDNVNSRYRARPITASTTTTTTTTTTMQAAKQRRDTSANHKDKNESCDQQRRKTSIHKDKASVLANTRATKSKSGSSLCDRQSDNVTKV